MVQASQRRIRALLELESVELIHNDLSNAAYYFKSRMDKRIKHGERDGVFHEMMAALMMTAFSLEAYLNFIGWSKLANWNERKKIHDKLKAVCEALGIKADYDKRPLSTVGDLIEFRNMIAHGKPRIVKDKRIAEGTHDELTAELRGYQAELDRIVTPDFVKTAYDDVEKLWQEMLTAANIDVMETLDGGGSSIEFIAFADQQ